MARILISVGDAEMRQAIAERVSADHETLSSSSQADVESALFDVGTPGDEGDATPADLCIVDCEALRDYRTLLASAKTAAEPVFLPVVLVRPPDESPPSSAWELVDADLELPTHAAAFEARLSSLLDTRSRSQTLRGRVESATRRFETLMESVNDAVFVVDPESDAVVDCNRKATAVIGYTREELLTRSPADDLFPDDADDFRTFVADALDSDERRTATFACRRPDGSRIEVDAAARALETGDDAHLVVSLRDVTERVRRERDLKRRDERLRDLHRINRTIRDTVHLVARAQTRAELERDVTERIAEADHYRFAWIGAVDGDRIRPTARSGIDGSDLDRLHNAGDDDAFDGDPIAAASESGRVHVATGTDDDPTFTAIRSMAGGADVKSIAAVPLSYGDTVYGVLGVYADRVDAFDHDMRKTFAELGKTIGYAINAMQVREELNLFKEAFTYAGHGIMITDADGVIRYVNPAFETLTGYSSEEAVGQTPAIIQSGKHDDGFYDALWETISTGDVWHGEIFDRRKNGELLHVDQTISPIRNETGDTEYFVAILADVTEQKRRRQQLQVLYRVLRHRLRNDMNVIDGYLDLLREGSAMSTEETVSKITQTTDNLINLSRQANVIEQAFLADDEDRFPDAIDVVESVRRLADVIGTRHPEADVTTHIHARELYAGGRIPIALREVLRNAVEHSDREHPSVSVTVTVDGGDADALATIEVRDDGPGIPENERAVLRAGEESPLLHGSGLGLWLVHWIVTECGGDVVIEDNEPRGSVVRLTIPVRDTPPADAEREDS